jgi:chemotaxis protein methyltransferase CheR
LNRLTINHTYFFRNEAQFKALEERVLPELIERKRSSVGREHVGRGTSNVQRPTSYGTERPTLRIWSAGCSTGEEPYSIAISLRETIPDIDEWDVQIFATDASEEALSRARRGIYGKNAVKPVSEERLEKYFTESADRDRSTKYEVRSTIKKMVTFNFHNLIEDEFQFGFDIIFCRNVVIYFEMDTTMNCISSDLFGHLGVI